MFDWENESDRQAEIELVLEAEMIAEVEEARASAE